MKRAALVVLACLVCVGCIKRYELQECTIVTVGEYTTIENQDRERLQKYGVWGNLGQTFKCRKVCYPMPERCVWE